jgi:hypothetical protein
MLVILMIYLWLNFINIYSKLDFFYNAVFGYTLELIRLFIFTSFYHLLGLNYF